MNELSLASESPESTPALIAAACSLIERQRYQEAAATLDRALARNPDNADIWNALGLCARELGQYEAALSLCRRAIALAPRLPGAWSNIGLLHRDLRMPEMAIACLQRALDLQPEERGHHHNLGVACAAAVRHRDAVAAFDRALVIAPGNAPSTYARALCRLALGDFRRGWADYQARFAAGITPSRRLPGRPWTREPYDGQRLVIAFEQGLGDGIWAARALPAAKSLGDELIVECPETLIPLLSSMGVVDRFVPYGESLPDADWHCHLCGLPGLLDPDAQEIRPGRYLHSSPSRRDRLRILREVPTGVLKIGIVWSGNTRFKRNMHRATSLRRFVDAFALPGVRLFSLQKGGPEGELEDHPGVVDLAPLLGDFADTAAAVDGLDLVIMTDTAVAHLAGALDKPVWVLLGYDPAWFWLVDRSDSPWYPSLRLFRPRGWGDWTSVFDSAAAELMRLVVARVSAGPVG
jgi:Tfp pilus assembly protein PilF